MNRRTLKRLTSNLCGELFAECVVLSHIHKDKQEQIDKIMVKIRSGWRAPLGASSSPKYGV